MKAIVGTLTLLIACVAEPAPDTDSEHATQSTQEVGARWTHISGCARTIAVSPDDTIWVTGCTGGANKEVWYLHPRDPWALSVAHATRINVDNGGQVYAATADGALWIDLVPITKANEISFPSDEWVLWGVPPGPVAFRDVLFNHLDQVLLFRTANAGTVPFESHDLYALEKKSSDGRVYHMNAGEGVWHQIPHLLAKQIVLFRPQPGVPVRKKDLWALDSSGVLRWVDHDVPTPVEAPPGSIVSVTDSHVLTTSGVYRWSDLHWSKVVDRSTPTGTIVQIAFAGAADAWMPERVMQTFTSELWGIDDAGQIYVYAVTPQ